MNPSTSACPSGMNPCSSRCSTIFRSSRRHGLLVIEPRHQREVRIGQGIDLGKCLPRQLRERFRLRHRQPERSYDLVQRIGVWILELDSEFVENEARGEIDLRIV